MPAPPETTSTPSAQPAEAAAPPPRRRRRWGVGFWLALGWLVAMLVASLAAPLLPLPGFDESDYTAIAQGPSLTYPLGTDDLGRDILSRVITGARVSLLVGACAVLLGMLVGSPLGMLAGYLRGRFERVITSLTDALLAFPALILLLGLTAVLGRSVVNITIALALVSVPAFVRLARATTLQVAQQEFVTAARSAGARRSRIVRREILPNVAPPTLAYGFIIVAVVIVAEGALSFLGLGPPPPTPTWGVMIADGRSRLESAPHISLVPSAVLFLTVFAFNVIGDRLRDRLDVREGAL